MGAEAIIAIVLRVLAALPAMIEAGYKVQGIIARMMKALTEKNYDPTSDDWQAVNNEIDMYVARLNVDPPPP